MELSRITKAGMSVGHLLGFIAILISLISSVTGVVIWGGNLYMGLNVRIKTIEIFQENLLIERRIENALLLKNVSSGIDSVRFVTKSQLEALRMQFEVLEEGRRTNAINIEKGRIENRQNYIDLIKMIKDQNNMILEIYKRQY